MRNVVRAFDETSPPRTEGRRPPIDLELQALVARQHGVASLTQLRAIGLSASGVRSRVAAGRLTRLHRGVYAPSPVVGTQGHRLAAVLASGPGALLSCRSGAALRGLRPDHRPHLDVTTPWPRRARPGIELHTCRVLTDRDRTVVDGIPVTSVARTLLDLAAIVNERELDRAVGRAEELRVLDGREIDELLARANGHRGAGRLRRAVARNPAATANALEDAMLAIVRRAGLPEPRVNQWLPLTGGAGFRPDFHWPDHRLVVETDGFEEHGKRAAFRHDRRRDRRLRLEAGIETARFTWDEVLCEPAAVGRELRRFLRLAAASAER